MRLIMREFAKRYIEQRAPIWVLTEASLYSENVDQKARVSGHCDDISK